MESELNRSARILESALTPKSRGLIKFGTPKHDKTSNRSLLREQLEGSVIETSKSVTGSSIKRKTEPWKQTLDSLYLEFLEILQSATSDHNVLDIVSDLARCCSDAATVMEEFKSKVIMSVKRYFDTFTI